MTKKDKIPFKNADLCTHCGYCLPMCPTYGIENNELHSPRGRVSIILALKSAEITPQEAASALDHCLVCRACHTACPAGVRPAKLAIQLRAMVPQRPTLFSALLHKITSSHRLTNQFSTLLAFYQRSGLQTFIRRFALLKPIPPLARLESMIPKPRPTTALLQPKTQPNTNLQENRHSARFIPRTPDGPRIPDGQPRKRVGLLSGCMARLFFPTIGLSTNQLLSHFGFEVIVLKDFGCCGSSDRESGKRDQFLQQAKKTLDAFKAAGPLDSVVCDSSVCATTTLSYARALANDATYAEQAKQFSAMIHTVSQFLSQQNPNNRPQNAIDPGFGTLTYHDHCQAQYGLGIMQEPRSLLAALPVTYCELGNKLGKNQHASQGCCGTGGHYLLRHHERSQAMMVAKLATIKTSGADTIVGENPGCLLHMASMLEQQSSTIQVRHLSEILLAAYPTKRVP